MSEITPFNFDGHAVRTITDNSTPMFCGKDVCEILGYTNTNDALTRHCKGVVKRYPLVTAGGTQEFRFITESDLYRLIVSSKLPSAEKFEQWVFEEVLPDIRKHGAYMTPEKIEEALLNPDTLIKLATDLKLERARRHELEAKTLADRPKVISAEAVNASHTTILIGELAKILRGNGVLIGQNRLFDWLRQEGYLIKRKGTDFNMPTQYAMELGLFYIKETAITHSDGHISVSKTTKVTGKGQEFFINKFLNTRKQVTA